MFAPIWMKWAKSAPVLLSVDDIIIDLSPQRRLEGADVSALRFGKSVAEPIAL